MVPSEAEPDAVAGPGQAHAVAASGQRQRDDSAEAVADEQVDGDGEPLGAGAADPEQLTVIGSYNL